MGEEISLSEKLDKVLEKMEETPTKKRFNFPMGVNLQKGKTLKKNFAIVQLIKTNGSVQFKIVPIHDNSIKVGDVYYEATAKHILRYNKYPLIVLPEWNISPLTSKMEPFDAEENYKEALEKGKLSAAERYILHAIKMDLVKKKMGINAGTIMIILAVLIGGGFLLSQLGVV